MHDPGAFDGSTVRRNGHVVHLERKVDFANKVPHEDGGSAKNAHHKKPGLPLSSLAPRAFSVIFRNLTAHFAHTTLDRLAVEQYLLYVFFAVAAVLPLPRSKRIRVHASPLVR